LISCLPWLTGHYSASTPEVRNLNRRLTLNVGGERHEGRFIPFAFMSKQNVILINVLIVDP
jgi:hypothetical protein